MAITRSMLPQNQGKFTLPLFGGNLMEILHNFIRNKYHKNIQTVTFFPYLW